MAIDWSRYEGSRYFSTKNVTGPLDLTVAQIVEELVGIDAEQELKVVVYVKEDPRGLVLNVDRRETLRGLFGDNTDRWIGKRFRLVVGTAMFKGKLVKALHVEAIRAAAKAGGTARVVHPEPEPEPPAVDDEVPYPDDTAWNEFDD
jgi:hypothetical protein